MRFADWKWADRGAARAGDWVLERLEFVESEGRLVGSEGRLLVEAKGSESRDIATAEDVVNGRRSTLWIVSIGKRGLLSYHQGMPKVSMFIPDTDPKSASRPCRHKVMTLSGVKVDIPNN